jgi:hypothetical protein
MTARSSAKPQTDPDIETDSMTPQRRTSPPDEVSPTGTFDTALTSPSTFDGSPKNTPAPQKISFEHNVKTSNQARGGGAGMLLGMTKPALGLAALLIMGTGAAAAFGWFKIPGLTSQIEALEEQVGLLNVEIGRLSGEVDRLETENDRYESLNDILNQTVYEFEQLNDDLNTTAIRLEDVSDQLNLTNQELMNRIDDLATENVNYAQLNQDLNQTASQLAVEVHFFEAALSNLILENGVLSNLTDVLQGTTEQLGNLTVEQKEILIELQEKLADFISENDRLEELNNGLVTIVTFLNATSIGLDDSLQQITGFLADQIVASQVLVLESLENTYRQRVSNWDCEYRDIFREEPFGTDFSVPITDMESVIIYVDGRVLSELCLDAFDFELYLDEQYPDGTTSFRLVRAVLDYTAKALDYYFPEADESGLTEQEWVDASFSCDNLPEKYFWSAQTNL